MSWSRRAGFTDKPPRGLEGKQRKQGETGRASQAPCKQGHELGKPDTGLALLPRHICSVTLAKSALWACFLAVRLGFGSDTV